MRCSGPLKGHVTCSPDGREAKEEEEGARLLGPLQGPAPDDPKTAHKAPPFHCLPVGKPLRTQPLTRGPLGGVRDPDVAVLLMGVSGGSSGVH